MRVSNCHHPHHLKEEKTKSDCRNYCVMFLLTVSGKILARFLFDCFPCYIIYCVLLDAHAVASEPVMSIQSVIEYLVSSKKNVGNMLTKAPSTVGRPR